MEDEIGRDRARLAHPQRARRFRDAEHLVLRANLAAWAYDPSGPAPSIDRLVAAASDGLALVDYNFSVLRDSGGDLEEYCLLVVSHRLYHLLWGHR